ncbi:AsmA family protein [Bartonella sp. LJL80]
MRSRSARIVVGVVLVVLLAMAAIALALPYLVSTDAIRIRLAQDLSAWTGYNVQLREAPHLELFPYPRASLSGVTLTPMADDASPLMEAECIEVDLSLVDALLGRVSFSETRIIRPHFIVEEPVKTFADFFDTISRSQGSLGLAVREAREIVGTNPDRPDTTRLLNQPFGRIVIENGELLYRESLGGMAEKITAINAVMEWPDSTRAASFRANARWHGQLTELRIDAAQALLLLAGGNSQIRVSLNSLRGGVTFDGHGRLSENYYFDGHLAARSPGWNQTLDWLGYQNMLGQGLKATVVWESGFTAQPERIQLNDVVFKLGNDSARGALEVGYQQSVPVTSGSLAFESLDLNTLVAALFPDEDQNEILDLNVLDRIGLDIRLSAPEAKLSNVTLTNLAAAIQIRNGRAIFDLGNANAFGGALQSNIQISRSGQQATIEGRVSGASIDVQAMTQALQRPSIINAKTGFILIMRAPFNRWSEVASQMTGQLTLNMGAGSIDGYSIDDIRTRLASENTFALNRAEDVSTAFDRFDVEAEIAAGNFTINKAAMRIGDWTMAITGGRAAALQGESATGYAVDLQSVLQKNQRSDTVCADVICLQNSLQQPIVFSLIGNSSSDGNIVVKRVNGDQ